MPSSIPPGAAALWLALAVLILLSVPLFTSFTSLRAEVARLRAAVVDAQVSGASPPSAEALASLQEGAIQSMAAEAGLQAALAGGIPWRAVLERIVPPPSASIRLTGLQQQGADLTIEGVALDDLSLRAYLGRLQGTPIFEVATLQASTSSAVAGAVAFTINVRMRENTR